LRFWYCENLQKASQDFRPPMKITCIDIHAVGVNQGGSWVFVQVHTDHSAISGLGELNPSAPRAACLTAVRQMEEVLKGRDPRRITAIVADLASTALQRAQVHALSAIEQALWDILGKSLDAPLHALLGGRCRDEIRLYANISRILIDSTPEEFAGNAARAVADGFDAVKIAPFANPRLRHDPTADIAHGIRCARAVRQQIGPQIDLLVDCYGIFPEEQAWEIAAGLQDLDLFWFEEPVADDNIAGYQALKANCGMRLAGGERLMWRQSFWPLLEHQMMQVVMPDVSVVGGISELMHVAAMAEARGVLTSPHGPFGPVIFAAQAQAMAAHPGFQILEYAWGQVPWRQDLIVPSETVVNGRLAVTEQPGLGIELNMEVVQAQRLEPAIIPS